MSIDFEAVGGVLLAVPAGIAQDRLTSVENSLLLAWLAAVKAGSAAKLEDTLAKIGWVLSDNSDQDQTLPLTGAGAAILRTAAAGGIAETLAARLTADQADPVIAAWWQRADAAKFFAFADIPSDATIRLTSFVVTMPSDRLLIFAAAPAVRLVGHAMTGVLNADVYGSVSQTIAEKVAPYRDQIVKA